MQELVSIIAVWNSNDDSYQGIGKTQKITVHPFCFACHKIFCDLKSVLQKMVQDIISAYSIFYDKRVREKGEN